MGGLDKKCLVSIFVFVFVLGLSFISLDTAYFRTLVGAVLAPSTPGLTTTGCFCNTFRNQTTAAVDPPSASGILIGVQNTD
jgi:hypothetical protein